MMMIAFITFKSSLGTHFDGQEHGAKGEFKLRKEAAHDNKDRDVLRHLHGVVVVLVVRVGAVARHLSCQMQTHVVRLFVRRQCKEEVIVLLKDDRQQHRRSERSVVVVVVNFPCLDLDGARGAFQDVELLAVLPQRTDVHSPSAPRKPHVVVEKRTRNVVLGTLARVLSRHGTRHGSRVAAAAARQHGFGQKINLLPVQHVVLPHIYAALRALGFAAAALLLLERRAAPATHSVDIVAHNQRRHVGRALLGKDLHTDGTAVRV